MPTNEGLLTQQEFKEANQEDFSRKYGPEYYDAALNLAYGVYYQQNSRNPDAQKLSSYQYYASKLPREIQQKIGYGGFSGKPVIPINKAEQTQNIAQLRVQQQNPILYQSLNQPPASQSKIAQSYVNNQVANAARNRLSQPPLDAISRSAFPTNQNTSILQRIENKTSPAAESALKGPSEFVETGRIASENLARSNVLAGFVGSSSAGLLGAGIGIVESASRPATTARGVRGLVNEAAKDPIATALKVGGEQQAAFLRNPAYYAGGFAGSELFLGGISKVAKTPFIKQNEINITGVSTRTQLKGIAGGPTGVIESRFVGNVERVPGPLAQLIISGSKQGSIFEQVIKKPQPLTVREVFNVGNLPKELFGNIASEKAGKPSFLIDVRGIGRKAQAEVKPQAEVLKSSLQQGFEVRTTGQAMFGKNKIEFGSTSKQVTNDFSGAVRKNESYFPRAVAEREVGNRTGNIGFVEKQGLPGTGAPQKVKGIPDPIRNIITGKASFSQTASGVKVQSGLFSGFEKVFSESSLKRTTVKGQIINFKEVTTTLGRKGSKSDFIENVLGNKTSAEIDAALRRIKANDPVQRAISGKSLQEGAKKLLPEFEPFQTNVKPARVRTVTKTKSTNESSSSSSFSSFPISGAAFSAEIEEVAFGQTQVGQRGAGTGFLNRNNTTSSTSPRAGTPPVFREIVFPGSSSKTNPLFSPAVNPITRATAISTPLSVPLGRPTSSPISFPLRNQRPEIPSAILPISQPVTLPISTPITKPITTPITLPLHSPFKPTKIKAPVVKFPFTSSKNPFTGKIEKGFVPVLFKSGKPIKVLSFKPLTRQEAIIFGARYVDRTTKASFKIFPKGFAVPSGLKGDVSILRPGKRDPSLFVEKNFFRISTVGEKRDLRAARNRVNKHRVFSYFFGNNRNSKREVFNFGF